MDLIFLKTLEGQSLDIASLHLVIQEINQLKSIVRILFEATGKVQEFQKVKLLVSVV